MNCTAPGCSRHAHAKGLCSPHYMSVWRHGTLEPPKKPKRTVAERLEKFISRDPGGCWLWTGALHSQGYGVLNVDGRVEYAHRLSYETFAGPIPDGLTIDHLCRVRGCVNPAHLEPVTQAENNLRGTSPIAANATKTHCPAGHPLEPPHVYVRRDGNKFCRTCAAVRRVARQHEDRAKRLARRCESCPNEVARDRSRFCAQCIAKRTRASKRAYAERQQRITRHVLGGA